MSGRDQLRAWVQENMPELAQELGPLRWDHVRVRLNEVTGLHLTGHDSIDGGALLYLEALKAKKQENDKP